MPSGTYEIDCVYHATPRVHQTVPPREMQHLARELESDAVKLLSADPSLHRNTSIYSGPPGYPSIEVTFVFSTPRGRTIRCNIYIRFENES